ncbi:hypothetical protein Tco_0492196 [Tanacetum coccineum]
MQLVLSLENKGKRLEVFIEEKGKEEKSNEDVPDIKKGRSTSTSIIEMYALEKGMLCIVSIADYTEGHPISIVEIYSETDKESTPVVKKEKIKMVLIEKGLKKKGKLIVEDSEITKNDSRKKVKIVVTKDQDKELIDEEEREDFNSKKFQVLKK